MECQIIGLFWNLLPNSLVKCHYKNKRYIWTFKSFSSLKLQLAIYKECLNIFTTREGRDVISASRFWNFILTTWWTTRSLATLQLASARLISKNIAQLLLPYNLNFITKTSFTYSENLVLDDSPLQDFSVITFWRRRKVSRCRKNIVQCHNHTAICTRTH